MNKNKILAIFFALTISGSLFISCAKENQAENTPDSTTAGETTSEVQETTEAPLAFPHEVKEFGDWNFTILIDRENGNELDIKDFDIEGETGDVLDDALYRRKLMIEDTYKVKFSTVHTDDITSKVNKTIKAGVDEYSALAPRLMNATKFSASGYGVDLTKLQNMTLEAPWWDQNCIKDMSFGKRLFLITGDIFYKHYDAIAMIGFNKRLVQELQLDNPYNLVNENKWTLDKFNEMAKTATLDVNGDGKMSYKDDQYGLSTQADYLTSMVNGCGEAYFSKNADDIPYFNVDNMEKIANAIDKVLVHYVPDTFCFHRDGPGAMAQFLVFPNGKSLFYWMMPRYIGIGLRSMEDDYGFLPIPKYDSSQTRYYDNVNHWHGYSYMIPVTATNPEDNAYIMEALAFEGLKTVKPAYYDVCLQRKYTRDNESSDMLDIIFSSTLYDFGFLYGVGGFVGDLEGQLYKKNSVAYASTYEKFQGKIDTALTKLIEDFDDIK